MEDTLNLAKIGRRVSYSEWDLWNVKEQKKQKLQCLTFDALKQQFLLDVKSVVLMEEIPQPRVLNLDQIAVYYIPVWLDYREMWS